MKKKALVIAVSGALVLSGCGQNGDSTSSVSQEHSTPRATYESVEQLRDSYTAAGGSCPDFKQTNVVSSAAESASCSDAVVLSTYLNPAAVQSKVDEYRKTFGDHASGQWLVGDNWIVNSPDVDKVKTALGGQVVSFGSGDASSGASSSSTNGEAIFKSVLLGSDLGFSPSIIDDATTKAKGYCTLYRSGTKHEDVLSVASLAIGDNYTTEQVGFMLGAGISAFCPQFSDVFDD